MMTEYQIYTQPGTWKFAVDYAQIAWLDKLIEPDMLA